MKTPPVALTIAGSDSGGCAGIQADLHTFAAHRVHGTSAITALTAQNTHGVAMATSVTADMVEAQLEAITSDFDVRAVKTGMLADPTVLGVVTKWARTGRLPNLVVDPVMVATSGDSLFSGDAQAYRELLAAADLITPNLEEAGILSDNHIGASTDLRRIALALVENGARAVLIKGGHRRGANVTDVLYIDGVFHELTLPRVHTVNTHGTGCTLSAAIAANMALGHNVLTAVTRAKHYLTEALEGGAEWKLGGGAGPVDHLHVLAQAAESDHTD
ncbi:bifunctional hydroxymethylpyrimidine kinase/phosphomethylpyrimidine kinase [Natronoglycomyces albus]|uniref:Bifunctional hydroxymethylpyrimidine kinase/phosphomethylpyrimidine kinase n=1 Tax=Natronoglycomyces albus TaxID=2811108 RepID=A0A895XV75_9ACTN|nr:bifunctional hydroxymethylpyrimidine kinase/phosphomethylpyrimidine kinase [Natronoglycomyces albus]QSB06130.1 bifunctional hydroxymethylpyrimidine kinase/phosphomethylpyrimidine kinase [Natronoglycomyces albus]